MSATTPCRGLRAGAGSRAMQVSEPSRFTAPSHSRGEAKVELLRRGALEQPIQGLTTGTACDRVT
ncbi:MAG: hypothetical protein INF48_02150 [Rhodobacter sp.]|nr:hypothetical protein [Rhodobacter sp.]